MGHSKQKQIAGTSTTEDVSRISLPSMSRDCSWRENPDAELECADDERDNAGEVNDSDDIDGVDSQRIECTIDGNKNINEMKACTTFETKPCEFLQISPSSASRILHPNPCCFLTTTSAMSNGSKSKRINAMTLSWLSPANNYGGFVFVIHKTRYSANSIVGGNGKFTLSVANSSHKDILLKCGKISGRNTDKFGGIISGLKLADDAKICAVNKDVSKKFVKSNAYSALVESDSSGDDEAAAHRRNNHIINTVEDLNDTEEKSCIPPVSGTVAHLSCHELHRTDAADAGHWLIVAQIDDAFVHKSYWNGKTFEPHEQAPPLLSFLGSQKFGVIMPEEFDRKKTK